MNREKEYERLFEKERLVEKLFMERSEASGLVVSSSMIENLLFRLYDEIAGFIHRREIPDEMFEEVVELLVVDRELYDYNGNWDYNINLFVKYLVMDLEDEFIDKYEEVKPPMSQEELENVLLESMEWDLDEIKPIIYNGSEIHPFIMELGLVGGSKRRNFGKGRRKKFRKNKKFRKFNNNNVPRVIAQPRQRRTLRFIATALVSDAPITCRCLLNLMLALNNTATAYNVMESVRIRRISIRYAPPPDDGLGNSTELISINWKGLRSPDMRFIDRGTLSHLAMLSMTPPFESLARYWANNDTNGLNDLFCTITVPQYGIVDLDFEYIPGDGSTRSVTINNIGGTGIAYPALDNAIVAGTVGGLLLQPDDLTYVQITTP